MDMNTERIKTLMDHALNQLAADLERGASDSLRRYLAAMANFHHYSFRNLMLILAQCPEASRVAGFRKWKTLGRYVKKGEKGLVITAPMLLKRDADAGQDDRKGTEPGEHGRGEAVRFRGVCVFDISQTDGDPLPDLDRIHGEPGEYSERLRNVIANRGIEVSVEEMDTGMQGYSAGGRIAICPGLSPAEEFSVLVHEFAHELLHHAHDRPEKRKTRELEAEAVAFVVSQGVGLETGSASTDYIQLYRGDKPDLLQSLERIRTTASDILSKMTADNHAGALAVV